MAPFMPLLRPGAGSPFQWGDEAYCRSMLGDAFELSFEELDSRHEGDDAREMWNLYRVNYGPSFTLWTSLDEERRAKLDDGHGGVLRDLPGRRGDRRGAALHHRHGLRKGTP